MAGKPEPGFGWPPWWPTIISVWGMAAATFSDKLHLSEALYPIIGVAIMAGPAAYGDRWLRRKRDEEE